MSMVHVATGAHVGTLLWTISKNLIVHYPCCHQRLCWCPFLDHCCSLRLCWWSWSILPPQDKWLSIAWAAAWGHVDICCLCCCWRPCWCLWIHVIARGYVDVCGLCCSLRPCCCLCSNLPLDTMYVSVVLAAARGHVMCGLYCSLRQC